MPGEEWPWTYSRSPPWFSDGACQKWLKDPQHVGQRGERGDVAAQVAVEAVGLDDHRHRVPAHPRAQALFIFEVARAVLFEVRRDGVHISGIAGKRDMGTATARQVDQALQQVMRAIGAFEFDHRFERVEPFLGLERIRVIGGLGRQLVELS